jgi:hypothetical protein
LRFTPSLVIGEQCENVPHFAPYLRLSRVEARSEYIPRKQQLGTRRCNVIVNRDEIDAASGQTIATRRDDVSRITGLPEFGKHPLYDRPPFEPVSAAALDVFAHDARIQLVGGLLTRLTLHGYLRLGRCLFVRPGVSGTDKYDGSLAFVHISFSSLSQLNESSGQGAPLSVGIVLRRK